MEIISLHLAGSTKCEGQAFLRRVMAEGMELNSSDLYLLRDKNNQYDANAVQVWSNRNGERVRLGFIKKEQAPVIANYLDHGWDARITYHNICGSAVTNYGLYFTACMTSPAERNQAPDSYQLRLRKIPF